MLKVFITGASGFVGRHLIQSLKAEGKNRYDIYGTSYPEKPSASEKKLYFLDIRNQIELIKIIRNIKPHWIIHLAAVSSVRRSWEQRKETLEINILGTLNLLEAIRAFSPYARILFISSSEVYKFNKRICRPVTEKSPINILNPYAYSKIAGEILCKFYKEVEKLDIIIARPFPHTGPGQSEQFVCSDWAKQIAEIESAKKPPIIQVGNLNVITDYCDVRDVVKAYVLLLQRGKAGEVYNICSGRPISLRKILELLIKESGLAKKITVKREKAKFNKNDLPVRLGKNDKIKKEIGWKPIIPIDKTLRDLLVYWREKYEMNEGKVGR